MRDHEYLLLANKAWATERLEENAAYFQRQTAGQKPEFLWIGCSDSRVAPDQLTNSAPGGIFIHRNIANLVDPDDLNLMSAVQYAVEVLGVDQVIVCGHYGCGGIAAALMEPMASATGRWLEPVRQAARDHADELNDLSDEQRVNRLVELNVRDQLIRLADTDVIRRAFAAGRPLELHGWVYDLRDGRLKPLMEIDRETELTGVPRPASVLT